MRAVPARRTPGRSANTPAADRFTELMEAELAAARPRQALVNACMGGMDASGILPMTRRLVRVIGRVERVIYAYNLNDALQGPRLQEMARQSRAIQALLNDPATSWSDSAVAPVADDLVFRMGLPLLRLWKSPTALWLLRRAAGGRPAVVLACDLSAQKRSKN